MCHLQLGKKVKHGTLDKKIIFLMTEMPKSIKFLFENVTHIIVLKLV